MEDNLGDCLIVFKG